jgi:hypothetical protein
VGNLFAAVSSSYISERIPTSFLLNTTVLTRMVSVDQRDHILPLCCFMRHMNPSLLAASKTIEYDSISKEGLITSSRVYPTSFCSITVMFNKLPSIAWGIIDLRPSFDWITLRRVGAAANRINQSRTRKVLLLGNCKMAHFRGTYCCDCFTVYLLYYNSNTISFFL